MKTKKIAFVHYSHLHNLTRLETMPFALNSVAALANAGWEVDVYLWEKPSSNYDELLPKSVNIVYSVESQTNPLNKLLTVLWLQVYFKKNGYYCAFGLGPKGAYIADIIAKSSQCPFVYINDEFPSEWQHNNLWKKLEKQAVKNAAMVVVPDKHRFQPLSQELPILASKVHAVLPNIPIIQTPVEEIDWHQKLNLPEDSIPFLHAGSINDWAQIPEILSSVPYWPEKAVLVLHGRSEKEIGKYRKYLSHLDIPTKVFWSPDPLTVNYLNSLVSYCTANFALYRNTGPNFEYIGFSSGKLMRSLAYGRPVIASKMSSLSFVTEHNIGVLVNHPVEIPNAIKQIMQDRVGYKNRCLSFCKSHASFEKHWEKFCEQLRQTTTVDLR